jgi:hypothetical protein
VGQRTKELPRAIAGSILESTCGFAAMKKLVPDRFE